MLTVVNTQRGGGGVFDSFGRGFGSGHSYVGRLQRVVRDGYFKMRGRRGDETNIYLTFFQLQA